MFMTDQQPTKLSEPGIGSLDDPASFKTAQLAAIFIAPVPTVLPVGNNQLDASFAEPLAQRVRVIGLIGDDSLRLLAGAAFGAWDADFGERGFRKTSFSRRGTFKPNSQRKTLTIDQYHPLRTLATLGFADGGAPFLAGAKLPSRKVSSPCKRPSPSSAPSSARQASSQTPCSSHCFNRRQQVTGEGYLSGRNRHAAPVRSTHKMPSRQARFVVHFCSDAYTVCKRPSLWRELVPERGDRPSVHDCIEREEQGAATTG